MFNVENRYKYDNTFRRVVDLMCVYLSEYQITPSELRQAAVLASTMHEAEHIKPLLMYIDEANNIPPAMFGSVDCGITRGSGTACGSQYGSQSGRIQCSELNFTVQDKQSGWNKPNWGEGTEQFKYKCICGALGVLALHTQTCKDYNWSVTHPKAEHCHTFGNKEFHEFGDYRVCVECGMSDVYYNWSKKK